MSANKWQTAAPALLIGIGLGTALALLFASKSGEETRDDIAKSVKDGVDVAVAQGNQVAKRARKTYSDAKDQLQDIADAAAQGFRDGKSAGA